MRKRKMKWTIATGIFFASALMVQTQANADDFLEKSLEHARTSFLQDEKAAHPVDTTRVVVELEQTPAYTTAPKPDGTAETAKQIDAAEDKIVDAQEPVKDKVEDVTGQKVENTYGYLMNGFTIKATDDQAEKISKMAGVKEVRRVRGYALQDINANQMTGAVKAWKEKTKNTSTTLGQGMVVAVIDSGVDGTHKDMRLDSPNLARIKKADADKAIHTLGYGAYVNDKVPFAYSYADKSSEHEYVIAQQASHMHGQHVAGIIGANGYDDTNHNGKKDANETSDGIHSVQGVAPEAQILDMRVFGNGCEYCYTDDIIHAIQDSVKLGADVFNMSLGGYNPALDKDPMANAVNAAAKLGVIPVISAGNEAAYTSKENPDYSSKSLVEDGMVGTPGNASYALTVASANNVNVVKNQLSFKVNGKSLFNGSINVLANAKAQQMLQNAMSADALVMPDDVGGSMLEVNSMTKVKPDEMEKAKKEADIFKLQKTSAIHPDLPGRGFLEDYDALLASFGIDGKTLTKENAKETPIKDKWVIVSYSNIYGMSASSLAVTDFAAKGVIVINDTKNDGVPVTYPVEEHSDVPTILLSLEDGTKLTKALGKSGKIDFSKMTIGMGKNIGGGQLSSFSSWGPVDNLEMKPEITGVGGDMYSLTNATGADKGGYQNMCGTSMSAPFVAGAATLVAQHLKEDKAYNGKKTTERGLSFVNDVKTMMETTATPVINSKNNVVTSVRKQGSGLVNIENAVKNKVIVRDAKDGDGMINLKEIGSNTVNFAATFENKGTKDATYTFNPAKFGATAFTETLTESEKQALPLPDYSSEEGTNVINGTNDKETVEHTKNKLDKALPGVTFVAKDGNKELKKSVPFKVKAGKKMTVNFTMHFDSSVKKQQFVEGYLYFEPTKAAQEGTYPLHLTYMGYYGDFDKDQIIDPTVGLSTKQINANQKSDSYHGLGYLVSSCGDIVGGTESGIRGFSNKTGRYGDLLRINTDDLYYSTKAHLGRLNPLSLKYGLIRDAAEVKVEVLDSKKQVIRQIDDERGLPKGIYNSAPFDFLKFNANDRGDAITSNGLTNLDAMDWLPDGQYYFRLSASTINEPNKFQQVDYPVILDSEAPDFYSSDWQMIETNGQWTLTGQVKDNQPLDKDKLLQHFSMNGEPLAFDQQKVEVRFSADKRVADVKVTFANDIQSYISSGSNYFDFDGYDAAGNIVNYHGTFNAATEGRKIKWMFDLDLQPLLEKDCQAWMPVKDRNAEKYVVKPWIKDEQRKFIVIAGQLNKSLSATIDGQPSNCLTQKADGTFFIKVPINKHVRVQVNVKTEQGDVPACDPIDFEQFVGTFANKQDFENIPLSKHNYNCYTGFGWLSEANEQVEAYDFTTKRDSKLLQVNGNDPRVLVTAKTLPDSSLKIYNINQEYNSAVARKVSVKCADGTEDVKEHVEGDFVIGTRAVPLQKGMNAIAVESRCNTAGPDEGAGATQYFFVYYPGESKYVPQNSYYQLTDAQVEDMDDKNSNPYGHTTEFAPLGNAYNAMNDIYHRRAYNKPLFELNAKNPAESTYHYKVMVHKDEKHPISAFYISTNVDDVKNHAVSALANLRPMNEQDLAYYNSCTGTDYTKPFDDCLIAEINLKMAPVCNTAISTGAVLADGTSKIKSPVLKYGFDFSMPAMNMTGDLATLNHNWSTNFLDYEKPGIFIDKRGVSSHNITLYDRYFDTKYENIYTNKKSINVAGNIREHAGATKVEINGNTVVNGMGAWNEDSSGVGYDYLAEHPGENFSKAVTLNTDPKQNYRVMKAFDPITGINESYDSNSPEAITKITIRLTTTSGNTIYRTIIVHYKDEKLAAPKVSISGTVAKISDVRDETNYLVSMDNGKTWKAIDNYHFNLAKGSKALVKAANIYGSESAVTTVTNPK